jgi:hypothetical protein
MLPNADTREARRTFASRQADQSLQPASALTPSSSAVRRAIPDQEGLVGCRSPELARRGSHAAKWAECDEFSVLSLDVDDRYVHVTVAIDLRGVLPSAPGSSPAASHVTHQTMRTARKAPV